MSAAPIQGGKPDHGTAVNAASGSPSSGAGQGGTTAPVAGGVPGKVSVPDIPAAFLPDRGLRESITFGQGTPDNDSKKAH